MLSINGVEKRLFFCKYPRLFPTTTHILIELRVLALAVSRFPGSMSPRMCAMFYYFVVMLHVNIYVRMCLLSNGTPLRFILIDRWRLPTACPGSRVRSELATAGETVGSSPTSSRRALETLVTRTRMGDGRRLSGERCGGCGMIGEEIVQQPPQPVFFYTGPDPTGTQTRKGILNQV